LCELAEIPSSKREKKSAEDPSVLCFRLEKASQESPPSLKKISRKK